MLVTADLRKPLLITRLWFSLVAVMVQAQM